ncbi:hypothetical protein [Sphingobacterium paucimobilis]|uniref:GH16 domain-containing protein n=1 Tax=Sphingobacterium paucimobilis HER1398 TaxID=1346330 RepID=U2J5T7_9SPHI|nr:hypothetical protein [Sphingobacterium paucimobilis]ERJ57858.1 hypothetical protein M472_03670 [Sphingobacterium paucimobilis HER1398]ERJ60309.1 hypothetical protein M472_16240 [Sphingobacterium paucimobilis HER1398]
MKIKATLFLAALCAVSLNSYAQRGEWTGSNTVWSYDMTKKTAGQDSVGGDNLSLVSTGATEAFLPSPSSGSAIVTSTKGSPSFIHQSGSNASVKVRAANEDGSPAKFSLFGIKEATPVAAISFTITPNHQAKKSDWYIVLGKEALFFKDGKTTLPINKTGSSPNAAVFASFRLQSSEGFGEKAAEKYRFQTREQAELEDDITWANSNTNLFTRGKKHEVEIYANNTMGEQSYTLNGTTYKVPKRSYHLWIDGKKIGADFQANAVRRNQPLDSFLIMSRDAVSGSVGSKNASTIEVRDVKIKYAAR